MARCLICFVDIGESADAVCDSCFARSQKQSDMEQEENQKEFNIPVIYEMWGLIRVKADSLEDAISKVETDSDHYPLPDEGQYIEGSFQIDYDGVEIHNDLTDKK